MPSRKSQRRDDEGGRKSRNPLTEPQLELSLGSTSRGKLTSPTDSPLLRTQIQRAGEGHRGSNEAWQLTDEEWAAMQYARDYEGDNNG